MATDAARQAPRGNSLRAFLAGIMPFLREVRAEMHKVTWPGRRELWEATRAILIFVFVIAAVIGLLDLILQLVLVKAVPSLFQ